MKVGDIVYYKGKEYYLYSLYKGDLCRIVRLRDGKYTHTKNGEECLNANIVNLNINELKYMLDCKKVESLVEEKMNNKKTITVLPQLKFDEYCIKTGLDDSNVENANDKAFISIIGTPECLIYYLDEGDTKHHFKGNHSNVLNLDFDDIGYDEFEWEGHIFKGMSMEQAQELFEFIEKNIDKSFIIHCRAGFSRSQAVGNFINDFYKGEFYSDTLLSHPNKDVYRKLSRCYYKKYRPDYE